MAASCMAAVPRFSPSTGPALSVISFLFQLLFVLNYLCPGPSIGVKPIKKTLLVITLTRNPKYFKRTVMKVLSEQAVTNLQYLDKSLVFETVVMTFAFVAAAEQPHGKLFLCCNELCHFTSKTFMYRTFLKYQLDEYYANTLT